MNSLSVAFVIVLYSKHLSIIRTKKIKWKFRVVVTFKATTFPDTSPHCFWYAVKLSTQIFIPGASQQTPAIVQPVAEYGKHPHLTTD